MATSEATEPLEPTRFPTLMADPEDVAPALETLLLAVLLAVLLALRGDAMFTLMGRGERVRGGTPSELRGEVVRGGAIPSEEAVLGGRHPQRGGSPKGRP